MTELVKPDLKQYDYLKLDRQLDRVKSRVFMNKGAAFFGPLLSSMEFYWDTGIETAATDGVRIWWNPGFFMEGPTKYNAPGFNEFVLRHELWHPARLHMLRMDGREPILWNYACDVRINNDLKKDGYDFGTFPAWYKPELDDDGPMVEEDIYDRLFKQGFQVPFNPWGNEEFKPPSNEDTRKTINNVVKSVTNAKIEDKMSDIPGGTQLMLDHFLAPVVQWEKIFQRWFTDLINTCRTWRRPRRRMMPQNIYLPSRFTDDGRLAHLLYMQDVSGSITNQEIIRFNSELKYVWDTFKPKKMTIVQFDDIIQKVDVLNQGDEFARIEIIGRGGNNMHCVANFIDDLEHAPTAVIIFADMQFEPMRKLKDESIPVLWINSGDPGIKPPYGEMIHIPVSQGRPFR